VKDDRIYLEHILECLDWIGSHTAEGRESFMRDRKTQSAVPRELQTMAESTQRLRPALKAAHPSVPWQSIAGFRNLIVHDYLGVSLDWIWGVVEQDLPPLRTAVETMRDEPLADQG